MFPNKQKRLFAMELPVILIGLLLLTSVSWATVKEVTLFPHSAKVEETIKIHPPPQA